MSAALMRRAMLWRSTSGMPRPQPALLLPAASQRATGCGRPA
jgi:hypothetical protein